MLIDFTLDTNSEQDVRAAFQMLEALMPRSQTFPRYETKLSPEAETAMVAGVNKLGAESVSTSETKAEAKAKAEVKVEAETASAAPAKPTRTRKPKIEAEVVKTVTVDEIRLIMVDQSKIGPHMLGRQKELLQRYGVHRLSEIPPERLVEFKQEVSELSTAV